MGSGLILLVIVAAWLAVLVPMALRSHESSTSLSSVDRFSDAMRVLSRRDAAARARARREADDDPLSAQAWAENDDEWDDAWDDDLAPIGWRERLDGWRDRLPARPHAPQRPQGDVDRSPSSPTDRRRRLLLGLVGALLLSTAGGLIGPPVLLAVAAVLAVAVTLFVLQLRRLAVAQAARARRARRAAMARPVPRPTSRPVRPTRPVRPPVRAGSVRVQTADVHPPEPRHDEVAPPVAEPEPVVASVDVWHDEPLRTAASAPVPPAPAAALGGAWSPVPVPPPTYVSAPRAPRIVDLTRPGAWSQEQVSRPAEELPGTAQAAPPAADRRRAVNEW